MDTIKLYDGRANLTHEFRTALHAQVNPCCLSTRMIKVGGEGGAWMVYMIYSISDDDSFLLLLFLVG